jgi:mono/diheme cytochrome c family protein
MIILLLLSYTASHTPKLLIMKKLLRIIGYSLLVIIVLVAGLLTYIKMAMPNVGPAPDLKVDGTPERIQRGKYLANCVTVCVDCHSTRDWNKFMAPLIQGTMGKGGERFDSRQGFPGTYYAKNITPEGISRYTDGELFRLITTGVTKEGRAMFPVMPYHYYGKMDSEDIKSLIAYLRTLAPLTNKPPESVSDFPMNFIINTIPEKAVPVKLPARTDQVAYGAYMTNAAACIECHTPVKRGQIMEEFAFSGGRSFIMADGSVVRSANLTPDPETGLGNWTKEQFIARFKLYADTAFQPGHVNPGEFNTIMPWLTYTQMDKEDLAAIFTYLKQVKIIKNTVVKFTVASNATAAK